MPSELAPPPQPAPEQMLAARLHAAARRLVQERRAEEALPMLDRLARLPGLGAPAAALRAEALAGLGRMEEAEAAADFALLHDPDWPAVLQLRAHIRLHRGERGGAIEDAAAAVMATPWDPAAKAALGTALLGDSRFDEAIWFLGEALQGDPTNPLFHLRLGQAFMLAGRHAAAAELFAHCAAVAEDLPGLAALQAQNSLLAGDPEAAVATARGALVTGAPDAATHSVLAHALVSLGRLDEAAPHFTAAARLAPENGYLAHLAASASGSGTGRATDSYVTTLFDGYAAHFEGALLALGYRVPGLIRRAVERLLPEVAAGTAKLGPVLDLGCGTGLVGVVLADLLNGPLTGIDLSRGMLDRAAAKGLYASLQQGEISAALYAPMPPQALIVAADVFCYLGRLEEVLALCCRRLAPGGLLLFSVERLTPEEAIGTEGWWLGKSGRYAHASAYVADCLAGAGLTALEWREEALRLDAAGPVAGLLVAARPDAA